MIRSKGMLQVGKALKITGLFLFFSALVTVISPLFGAVRIPPSFFWNLLTGRGVLFSDIGFQIVLYQRVPRVLLGLICGGALALAGGVFQALLRNPLATPYTLGVSAGAALGAVVAISFGTVAFSIGPVTSVQIFALVGAVATIMIVYLLGSIRGSFSGTGLLLAGVTLGLILSAVILLVRYLSHPHELVMMDRWMTGSLDVIGYAKIKQTVLFIVPGAIILFAMAPIYNQLSFGEEMAAGRGIEVARIQKLSFFAGSLVTSGVVAVCGPIGFVGLIVPHIVRKLTGPDHRLLLPLSFLLGGDLLVLCDTLSRTIIAPLEFPVGIITALLGGPFFLWLLVMGERKTTGGR